MADKIFFGEASGPSSFVHRVRSLVRSSVRSHLVRWPIRLLVHTSIRSFVSVFAYIFSEKIISNHEALIPKALFSASPFLVSIKQEGVAALNKKNKWPQCLLMGDAFLAYSYACVFCAYIFCVLTRLPGHVRPFVHRIYSFINPLIHFKFVFTSPPFSPFFPPREYTMRRLGLKATKKGGGYN